MLRWVMGAMLLAGLSLLPGGCTFDLGGSSCPKSECSGYGSYCQGSKVMSCLLYEGDPCIYNYLIEETDCASRGQKCVVDHCESR